MIVLDASTATCQVQMIAVQFHPEYYDDTHRDGQTLLENFCRFYL